MSEKFIVILRSSGIFCNKQLENILKASCYNVVTFPILKVEPLYFEPIDVYKAQAILTTSSNSIQIFSKLSTNREIPIYTVGNTSRQLAKRLGYKNVIDCNGDSVKMYDKVLKSCCRNNGDLIYIGAESISLDIPKMLNNAGYKTKRYIIYRTREVDVIDKKFLSLIKLKKIKWIVLLSKKGASNFNKLIKNNITINYLEKIKFACLSENIAKALSDDIKLKFFPTQPTLNQLKYIIMKNE